ncbi:MAG: hypothetical protein JWN10_1240 [Solirubrobacterales bacterium]|nr:hypothetical protein [Solirubrobacterales bacterium]
MPKHEAMAQLSRPFQIALAAVVVLAGVWLFALQGHFTSTSGTGSSPAVSTTTSTTPVARKPVHANTKAASPRASSTHSSARSSSHAPSGSGAHARVRHSNTTVTRTVTKAPARSVTKAPAKTVTKAPAKAVTNTPAKAVTKAPAKTVKAPTSTAGKGASAPATATLSGQHAVEADLARGDVVVLLFWNPSGTDDKSVQHAVQSVKSANHVAVQEAEANQVASYGSVTRGVQVYATPTIFVIANSRKAIVLNGVQDAFAIQQAIAEARSA